MREGPPHGPLHRTPQPLLSTHRKDTPPADEVASGSGEIYFRVTRTHWGTRRSGAALRKTVVKTSENTDPAQVLAMTVGRAMTSDRPRTRYLAGKGFSLDVGNAVIADCGDDAALRSLYWNISVWCLMTGALRAPRWS